MLVFFILIFIVISFIAVASSLKTLHSKGVLKDLRILPESLFGSNNRAMEVDGFQVMTHYHPGSKNNSSRYQLSTIGNFFANAVIRRETGVDKFGKQIGLNQETQLYDQAFDEAVYVECEDQDFVRQVLGSSDLKRELISVLNDFPLLQINGSACLLVKSPCPNPAIFTPEKIAAAAKVLAQVAGKIPPPAPGQVSSTPVTDQVRYSCGWLTGTGIIMAVAGIALSIWGGIAFEPLQPGKAFMLALKIAIPLFMIFMFYVYNQVKGLSNALAVLTGAFFAALVGLPLLLWGGLMVLNGSQDVSAAVDHQTRVIDKRVTHSKNSTSYHIKVSHWVPGLGIYDFTVPYHVYHQTNYGDPCTVTTRAGLFKFAWVSAKQCHRQGH